MERVITSCLVMLGLAAMLQADPWNKKTELTVNETIEVPGATLIPGKYVVKLLDSPSNRNIVQFTNETGDHVIATVLAIPNERLKPTGESEFSFYETRTGKPPALRAWFYPGDVTGHQFAYPKQKAIELATASGQDVPAYAGDDVASAEVTTVSPNKPMTSAGSAQRSTAPAERGSVAPTRTQPTVRGDREEPKPDPTIMAQARQPEPRDRSAIPSGAANVSPQSDQQPTAGQVEPAELPATGSAAPLLGLIGLLSLGGAFSLRLLAKREVRS
jgi:LPXTG-motif cell wall-anchored protein